MDPAVESERTWFARRAAVGAGLPGGRRILQAATAL
jgi:hypothetical protein